MHLDRLKKLHNLRKAAEEEEVKLIKHIPDRLKRKRKGGLANYNKLSKKGKNDDVVFIKQVPIHSRNSSNLAAIDEKVKFIKQVSVHPRDSLKMADKHLKQPNDRLKIKRDQIGRDNVSKFMSGELDFIPKKY